MTEAQRLAETINRLLPESAKSGSLRLFGEWFGGRRDAWHIITAATASDVDLVVRFNEEETLTVSEPRGGRIDPDTFVIEDATWVRWEWFYYGRPKVSGNLYTLSYRREGDGLLVEDSADWYEPQHRPDPSAPAVVID